MKILFITNYFYPEPFRNNELATELIRRGHKVKILTSYPSYPYGKLYDGFSFDKPYEKFYNGVEIERIKSAPRGKTLFGLLNNCISFIKKGKKWVDNCEEKFDVVYFPAISPSTSGLVAKYYKDKFKDTKMIIHIQDLWPENIEKVLKLRIKLLSNYINKIMNKIYDSSDYILCSSKSFAKYLYSIRNVDEKKLKFWPQFYIEPSANHYKKPIEYDDDAINIAFTGNVGYAQGLDILIDAANYIKSNHSDICINWYIIGDGRAKQELINKTDSLGLNDIIHFIGRKFIDEANNYSHYADLSYLSFKNEFFNMTIPAKLQGYLACKSPILCVAGGESAKIVNDNKCGFMAEKNPESIYKKILEYKNMTLEERNVLRDNSYRCYKKNFTMDKLIDELETYMR